MKKWSLLMLSVLCLSCMNGCIASDLLIDTSSVKESSTETIVETTTQLIQEFHDTSENEMEGIIIREFPGPDRGYTSMHYLLKH